MEIAARARAEQDQAVSAAVSQSGAWFLTQVAKAVYQEEDLSRAVAAADWTAYEEYLAQAQNTWRDALEARAASEQQWNSGWTEPTPVAPTPSDTATAPNMSAPPISGGAQ